MTKLQFTTELFNIINDLLEAGITSCNNYQARLQLESLFDTFEEDEDTLNRSTTEEQRFSPILDDISTKEKQMPHGLKEYFYTMDSIQKVDYILWEDECQEYEEDINHEDLQSNLIKDTPSVPITIDNFFNELNDIWQ